MRDFLSCFSNSKIQIQSLVVFVVLTSPDLIRLVNDHQCDGVSLVGSSGKFHTHTHMVSRRCDEDAAAKFCQALWCLRRSFLCLEEIYTHVYTHDSFSIKSW